MGSGKSVIGKSLSEKLNYNFIDTDEMIEKNENTSISKLFKTKGEPYFRICEVNLCKTFQSIKKTIISTGGGFPLNKGITKLTSLGHVVFLNASFQTIKNRISSSTTRPLNNNNLEELYIRRLPLYQSKSNIIVDVDEKTIEDIVTIILSKID